MDLFLVRHGIALDIGVNGINTDYDRTLSPKGRTKTKEVSVALSTIECCPKKILTSPLCRAVETAVIIAENLSDTPVMEESDHLACGSDMNLLIRWLGKQSEDQIMIVGHMPDLSILSSLLLSSTHNVRIAFKKAGVCCISFQHRIKPGEGVLKFHLEPKQLLLIAAPANQK
ncbi:MAG: histidine phosphatase family protein [Candidatus Theseobacter exili]|nr:histidine phosphatase family protein [Candidatus Theseobacter exili]